MVEATTLRTPLVMAGLIMLAKSKLELPDAPAPRMVCASSINNTQFFLVSSAVITSLSFSSNSPRYFEPANKLPISNDHTSWFFRNSGTVLAAMRCARPSTMAVLPTPGSPTMSTLALKRRASTVTISSTSESRPITGSRLSFWAMAVRFTQCSSKISVACWSVILASL